MTSARNRTPLARTPIAIVGMSAVFPQAKNLREYWDNIVHKIDCITDVPASRWSVDDYYDPDPATPDKTYCKRGGFIPDIDFDPLEFGLPPNILEVTDVAQLLALVVARDALADAGYLDTSAEIRERTGVVLGASGGLKLLSPLTSRLQFPVWEKVLKSAGVSDEDTARIIEKIKLNYVRWEENSFPGLLPNVVAGRVANRLDLGGMNCTVDAACASSMAAMKQAISDLTEGRADMMLTGGVDLDNSIFAYICFSKTPAFSQGEVPRPFDEASDGMMVGEGLGMIVLKRLEDAERDGDRIYAVIRGIGASSDGRYKSIYAPRGEGQELALKRAYEDAELAPDEVQLFEAHGTGTVAGDTTEVTTAVRFFNERTSKKRIVALGSVKSQIGHAKGAAGIAGLIKAALALHHKVLPATINVDTPNPKLGIETSALYINSETRPWILHEPGQVRRAGISSFGFGGTNFHVVMEEYNGAQQKGAYRLNTTAQVILMQALSPDALLALVEQGIVALNGDDANSAYLNLVRESRSMNIPAANARLGFAAASAGEALEMLTAAAKLLREKATAEEWQHPKGVFYRRAGLNVAGRVAALFSGQGSQYVDMGRELALNFPVLQASYGRIDTLFRQDNLTPVSEVVYPAPGFTKAEKDAQAAMLQRTDYVQPAIGAFSAGLFALFRAAGFQPDFTAGHSFGELTALWAAGALDDADYYALVKARGLAMAPPANADPSFDPGTMMAVTGNLANLERDLAAMPGVHAANLNSPKQVVIAGWRDALTAAKPQLEAKGYTVTPLSVAAAFHTPLVGHAQRPFAEAVHKATFRPARVPVYSNASAQPYPGDPAAMRQVLADHILNAVSFRQEIENLHAAGAYLFIEFGPRNVLTNLVKEILGERPHIAVALNGSRQKDSDRQFREAVAHLRVIGLSLGDIDPYWVEPASATSAGRKKGMSVKINGGAYVSDKTRQAFQDTLKDGFRIQGGATQVVEVVREVVKEVVKEVEVIKEVPGAASSPTPAAASLPTVMDQFTRNQAETLRAHEQYLANQAEYIRTFTQLAAQGSALAPEAAAGLAQSLNAFHAHQAETLRVHEEYLRRQSEYMQALIGMMRGGPTEALATQAFVPTAPVITAEAAHAPISAAAPAVPQSAVPALTPPSPLPQGEGLALTPPSPLPQGEGEQTAGVRLEALSVALLDIVADKTGYPSEMLELGMDIEADLGVDSIKRVEILGAMRERFPALPQLKPEELAELRTLAQIVDFMGAKAGGNAHAPISAAAPAVPQSAVPALTPPSPLPQGEGLALTPRPPLPQGEGEQTAGVRLEALSGALLDIVADKTGYPSEMLELGMDIEADLGVDSIKRVEILGAMRERFPALPQLKPEELAELRTLAQIVDFMGAKAGGLPVSANPNQPGVGGVPASGHDSTPHTPASNGAATSAPQFAPLPALAHHIPIHPARLFPLPLPDALDLVLPTGSICLLTDDGTPLMGEVAARLSGLGWRVVVLQLPEQITGQRGVPSASHPVVTLTETTETHLQAALANITAQHGSIAALIHLNPAATHGTLFAERETAILRQVFLLAKHLKKPITEAAQHGFACFVTIARLDGQFGMGAGLAPNGGFSAISGGLFGLTKSLNLEWPEVFCRALDIAATTPDAHAAAQILAEIRDPNRLLSEVAYGARGRVTLIADGSAAG